MKERSHSFLDDAATVKSKSILYVCVTTFLMLFIAVFNNKAYAQESIIGFIKSSKDKLSLPGTSIQNKRSKSMCVADDTGEFRIKARAGDTLSAKRLGFREKLYIVEKGLRNVNLYMEVLPVELPSVNIVKYNFLGDSLRLREEFRKSFDFRRPRWNEVITGLGPVISIDIYQLYRAMCFKDNRQKMRFKKILLQKEADNHIDFVFNADVVKRITGLESDGLETFMEAHRPTIAFVKNATTYDLYEYIKTKHMEYLKLHKGNAGETERNDVVIPMNSKVLK